MSLAQDTIWTRTYGGYLNDGARSIRLTDDGKYIVVGYTESFRESYADFYFLRVEVTGDTIWTRTFGADYVEMAYSVEQTADGGYVIAGYTTSFGGGVADFYVVKTDSLGYPEWSRNYGPEGDWLGGMEAYSVRQTSDGGYIIAGNIYQIGPVRSSFYLIKANSSGDTVWTRIYGGSYLGGKATCVHETADNGYILCGFMEYDIYLVKTDPNGDTSWTRTYDDGQRCFAYSMDLTLDGGYILAGMIEQDPTDDYDVYIMKTNEVGEVLWTQTYGGEHDDIAYAIQQINDGGYIIAGMTRSFGSGGSDIYLLRIDAEGEVLWVRTFGGSEDDEAYSVQLTEDGDYMVAGYTESYGAGLSDCWLLKISGDLVGVTEDDCGELPSDIGMIQNYPNPFNAKTIIRYNLPSDSDVTIEIYDILGRKIETLVSGYRPAGSHTLTWDAEDLPSGIYFYRIEAGGYSKTRRCLLLK